MWIQDSFRELISSDTADSKKHSAHRAEQSGYRLLRLEPLESRCMMSGAPANIAILTQPTNGILGANTTVSFEVTDASHSPVGGASAQVEVVGAQSGSQTVVTNPTTGVATASIANLAAGIDHLQLSLTGGVAVESNDFQVFPTAALLNALAPAGSTASTTPATVNLGTNVLPATDIPNDLPDSSVLGAALPWMVTQTAAPAHIQVPGSAGLGQSLEKSQLGNLIPLWRGGSGGVSELQDPNENDTTDKADTASSLEQTLDMIVVGSRSLLV